ncbi:MAG: hypothetical protein J0M04_03595 [Verrucomicrobia bacterium]|nr:hypothetical protein [Verrucomicrobiota bacterium]
MSGILDLADQFEEQVMRIGIDLFQRGRKQNSHPQHANRYRILTGDYDFSPLAMTTGLEASLPLELAQRKLHGVFGYVQFSGQNAHSGKDSAPMTGAESFPEVFHGLFDQRKRVERAHRENCPVLPDTSQEESALCRWNPGLDSMPNPPDSL